MQTQEVCMAAAVENVSWTKDGEIVEMQALDRNREKTALVVTIASKVGAINSS